jgi:hypothetical protein
VESALNLLGWVSERFVIIVRGVSKVGPFFSNVTIDRRRAMWPFVAGAFICIVIAALAWKTWSFTPAREELATVGLVEDAELPRLPESQRVSEDNAAAFAAQRQHELEERERLCAEEIEKARKEVRENEFLSWKESFVVDEHGCANEMLPARPQPLILQELTSRGAATVDELSVATGVVVSTVVSALGELATQDLDGGVVLLDDRGTAAFLPAETVAKVAENINAGGRTHLRRLHGEAPGG